MGAVAPIVGVVGAVAGVVQNNAAISANNRAIRLQQQANERAHKVRMLGLDLQEEQLRQQTEVDKLTVRAQAQQAQAAVDLQSMQRRLQVVQQLAGVDQELAQSVFDQIATQYELTRQAFTQQQEIAGQRTVQLNQAAQELNAIEQSNLQLVQAVKSGDISLANMLSRSMGAFGSTAAVESLARQQDFDIAKESLDSEAYQAQLQEQLLTSSTYNDFVNRSIEQNLARNKQIAAVRGEGQRKAGAGTKESLLQYNQASQNVESLASALIPTTERSGLLQADINQGYSMEALRNARLESTFGYASQNTALEANKRRRNILGDLATVATASVPLVQRVQYYNNQRRRGQDSFLNTSIAPVDTPYTTHNIG